MAEAISFYARQAESCAKAAAEATLANQKTKFLQAQAAWQALADKTALVQARAARREAERGRAGVE
ncbi:MAG: hypothetical protein WCY29_10525 [Novosphingobium sp.]